ncbi:MAG: NADPH-dependent F420 reductase [Actinomycetota bacterium]
MATVSILGTGGVGRTLAEKIADAEHHVIVGTRDPDASLAVTEASPRGLEPLSDWLGANEGVSLATFADSASASEVVFNATSGEGSLDALRSAGADNLSGKILIDVANPLDFSKGMPPTLLVANSDSLAEQIQREFPDVKVVKALNTVTASVMVEPGAIAGGDHHLPIAGNDDAAKTEVTRILREWFGWKHVLDVGDITGARGLEMYVILWVRMMMSLGTPAFNIKIVR